MKAVVLLAKLHTADIVSPTTDGREIPLASVSPKRSAAPIFAAKRLDSKTSTNLLNELSVANEEGNIDSSFSSNFIAPSGVQTFAGTPFYAATLRPF